MGADSVGPTGVYDEDFDEDPDDVEARFDKTHAATQYIGYHARKQLAFDLWWLALAVWLICIVERHRIGSTDWPWVCPPKRFRPFLLTSLPLQRGHHL
jgi:hypothetical protein